MFTHQKLSPSYRANFPDILLISSEYINLKGFDMKSYYMMVYKL